MAPGSSPDEGAWDALRRPCQPPAGLPAASPLLRPALTSTLHWQLEPVTGEEGLCTLSLARSHTA